MLLRIFTVSSWPLAAAQHHYVMTTVRVHHGYTIKRLREIQGLKQEALALALGEGWSQKKVSLLEAKPLLSEDLLGLVAKALKVCPEAIAHFNEEAVCSQFSSGAPQHPGALEEQLQHLEQLLALMQENKTLYERLLQAEREKNRLLEKLLARRK